MVRSKILLQPGPIRVRICLAWNQTGRRAGRQELALDRAVLLNTSAGSYSPPSGRNPLRKRTREKAVAGRDTPSFTLGAATLFSFAKAHHFESSPTSFPITRRYSETCWSHRV